MVAKLGIADLMAEGSKTSEQLAQETGCYVPSLDRILRALCGTSLFEEEQRIVSHLLEVEPRVLSTCGQKHSRQNSPPSQRPAS